MSNEIALSILGIAILCFFIFFWFITDKPSIKDLRKDAVIVMTFTSIPEVDREIREKIVDGFEVIGFSTHIESGNVVYTLIFKIV
jgi:hypothetical protein